MAPVFDATHLNHIQAICSTFKVVPEMVYELPLPKWIPSSLVVNLDQNRTQQVHINKVLNFLKFHNYKFSSFFFSFNQALRTSMTFSELQERPYTISWDFPKHLDKKSSQNFSSSSSSKWLDFNNIL